MSFSFVCALLFCLCPPPSFFLAPSHFLFRIVFPAVGTLRGASWWLFAYVFSRLSSCRRLSHGVGISVVWVTPSFCSSPPCFFPTNGVMFPFCRLPLLPLFVYFPAYLVHLSASFPFFIFYPYP